MSEEELRGTSATLRIVTKCKTVEELATRFAALFDEDSIFVAPPTPLAAGDRRRFSVLLTDGTVALAGSGEVMDANARIGNRSGARLRFVELDEHAKRSLDVMLATNKHATSGSPLPRVSTLTSPVSTLTPRGSVPAPRASTSPPAAAKRRTVTIPPIAATPRAATTPPISAPPRAPTRPPPIGVESAMRVEAPHPSVSPILAMAPRRRAESHQLPLPFRGSSTRPLIARGSSVEMPRVVTARGSGLDTPVVADAVAPAEPVAAPAEPVAALVATPIAADANEDSAEAIPVEADQILSESVMLEPDTSDEAIPQLRPDLGRLLRIALAGVGIATLVAVIGALACGGG